MLPFNWLSPKARSRPAGEKGEGIFALEAIEAGATVAAFGGYAVDRETLATLDEDQQARSIQVDEQLFLASGPAREPGDMVNHSCDPNAGLVGSNLVVTMRAIAPGEEICFDYAMCDTDDYDEFECLCGAASCRRKVTGNDWMIPELQERYEGFFSSYVARKIAALRAQRPTDSLL